MERHVEENNNVDDLELDLWLLALACDLAAYLPSSPLLLCAPGVVPNEGQHPQGVGAQLELLSTGPICRYASDLTPVLKVMAGPDASKISLDEEVGT